MATNKPQDDYKKTALRLPPELHERLHEAAAASGRSYNAEIVARLEESLERQQAATGMPHEIAAYLAALQNRSLMLDMRADMLKMRLDSIGVRVMTLVGKTDGLDMSSLTDAQLESVEAEIDDLRHAEAEMADVRSELKALQDERQEVLQSIRSVQSTVSTKVVALEKALADAAACGLKNPTDH